MAKWDLSKLEQEAVEHVDARRKQFSEGLRDYLAPLEQYIADNLHDTDERRHVYLSLQTALLFAEECSKKYGIK